MDTNLPTEPPKPIESGFDVVFDAQTAQEDCEPIPFIAPTVLFDAQTVRELNWEALSN